MKAANTHEFILQRASANFQLRPYNRDNTGSCQITEVKLVLAELVLRWVTTLEPSVLQSFAFFGALTRASRSSGGAHGAGTARRARAPTGRWKPQLGRGKVPFRDEEEAPRCAREQAPFLR